MSCLEDHGTSTEAQHIEHHHGMTHEVPESSFTDGRVVGLERQCDKEEEVGNGPRHGSDMLVLLGCMTRLLPMSPTMIILLWGKKEDSTEGPSTGDVAGSKLVFFD